MRHRQISHESFQNAQRENCLSMVVMCEIRKRCEVNEQQKKDQEGCAADGIPPFI